MQVLVTGATGLIGRRLVQRLLDRGDRVQVLAREPLRALGLRKLGAHVSGGDITRPQTLPHALTDVEVVYHVAGRVGPGILAPAYTLTNVTGVANMLSAAHKAGVARFVHVSSVAAYAHPGLNTTEDAPVGLGHGHNAYAVSKARGDLLVQAAGQRGDVATVIVRPVAVYDDGAGITNVTYWAKLLNRLPIIPLPAGGDFPFPIIHADDVAQLLVRCGTEIAAVGHAYNASGDEALTLRTVITTARPTGTAGPPILALPAGQRRRTGATFPATRAHTELQFAPTHHWGEAAVRQPTEIASD